MAWIEDIVINETMLAIMDDSVVEYIADLVMELQHRENTDLPRFKEQLAETEKAIENMLNAIQQSVLTSSTKQRLDELEETKSNLEISILQEQMQKPLLTREQLTFWICRFRNADVTKQDQRQRLIDIFINSVYIYDDHAVITFNYRDGTKTISLKKVEASGLGSSLSCFTRTKSPRIVYRSRRLFAKSYLSLLSPRLLFSIEARAVIGPLA